MPPPRRPPARKRQTTLGDHFPSGPHAGNPTPRPSNTRSRQRDRESQPREENHFSEDSDGMEHVKLSLNPTAVRGTLTQERNLRKQILDSDDEASRHSSDGSISASSSSSSSAGVSPPRRQPTKSEGKPPATRNESRTTTRSQSGRSTRSGNAGDDIGSISSRRAALSQLRSRRTSQKSTTVVAAEDQYFERPGKVSSGGPASGASGRQAMDETSKSHNGAGFKKETPLSMSDSESKPRGLKAGRSLVVEIQSLPPKARATYRLWSPDSQAGPQRSMSTKFPGIMEDDSDSAADIVTSKAKAARSTAPRSTKDRIKKKPLRNVEVSSEDSEPISKPRKKIRRDTKNTHQTPITAESRSRKPPAKAIKTGKRNGKDVKLFNGRLVERSEEVLDPDASPPPLTDDEDEDDIVLDQPERFKTQSRLRKKQETPYQRKLRKLKAARAGETISLSEEEDDEYEWLSDSPGSDKSAAESDDFIVQDGKMVQDGLLPFEFSMNSAQSTEFKFKVVFHYFVLLVIKGPKVLPLKGQLADYFLPNLADLRRRMQGYRDARVRSQIWRTEFVQSLKKFPSFSYTVLDDYHNGCDACHMSGRRSRWKVKVDGEPYDPETHEPIDNGSEEYTWDESWEKLPQDFHMGKFCKERAEVYHEMAHWEDALYYKVRGYYHDLLRARNITEFSDSEESEGEDENKDEDEDEKMQRRDRLEAQRRETKARVEKIRKRHSPPAEYKNVDKVTEWMDLEMGYQEKGFRWMQDLFDRSERLEMERSTADD